jgi:hypothetical protein
MGYPRAVSRVAQSGQASREPAAIPQTAPESGKNTLTGIVIYCRERSVQAAKNS